MKQLLAPLIVIVIIVIGFIGGYLYYSNAAKPSTATITKTVTITNIVTHHHTVTQHTHQSIMTVTETIETTKLFTFYTTYTETLTKTLVDTLIKFTTITASPEIKLSYPLRSSTELDVNGDNTVDAFVEINPWNMKSYKGTQQILIDLIRRIIKAEFNLTDIQPVEWVNGYPEVYIGRKPWGRRYANGFGVKFPMKISEMTPFVISFHICIEDIEPSMNFNIAADAWLVRPSVANNPGTSPGNGDVEIMVWIYRQNLNPAGRKVGEEIVPIVVNGSRVDIIFEVWREDSVSWGGWQYIAFVPKEINIKCGHVAYDPTVFVNITTRYSTFDISTHYLLGWEIGTEWGTTSSNGIARFVWILRDFTVLTSVRI